MHRRSFYVDSNIWLNLFKKEGNPDKEIPYWKIAQDFVNMCELSDNVIVYTGFVLRELRFDLINENIYGKALYLLKKFTYIKSISSDYEFARQLESAFEYKISFFDCMHIAICKRLNLILITRDKLLIEYGIKYIQIYKPEDLFF